MSKSTKWGTPRNTTVRRHGDWFVGLREFVCTDGTRFWQQKVAKDRYHFDDPTASIYGWKSKPSSRHRTDYPTRDAALAGALADIAAADARMAPDQPDVPAAPGPR